MEGFANNAVGWLVLWACLAFAIKLTLGYFNKRPEEKRQAARRAELKARQDARDDKRPTLADAIQTELDFIRDFTPRRDDTPEKRSEIWARLMLDHDLGRHAESAPPYELNQSQRDTLLANARRDAAEALKNSQAVLQQVQGLTNRLNEFGRYLTWALGIVVLYYWWKSGFTMWWR